MIDDINTNNMIKITKANIYQICDRLNEMAGDDKCLIFSFRSQMGVFNTFNVKRTFPSPLKIYVNDKPNSPIMLMFQFSKDFKTWYYISNKISFTENGFMFIVDPPCFPHCSGRDSFTFISVDDPVIFKYELTPINFDQDKARKSLDLEAQTKKRWHGYDDVNNKQGYQ